MATESAEKSILAELTRLAERIYLQHGIRIDSADFRWVDVSTVGGRNFTVEAIRATLSANP